MCPDSGLLSQEPLRGFRSSESEHTKAEKSYCKHREKAQARHPSAPPISPIHAYEDNSPQPRPISATDGSPTCCASCIHPSRLQPHDARALHLNKPPPPGGLHLILSPFLGFGFALNGVLSAESSITGSSTFAFGVEARRLPVLRLQLAPTLQLALRLPSFTVDSMSKRR